MRSEGLLGHISEARLAGKAGRTVFEVERMLYRQRKDKFGTNRMVPYIPVPLPPPTLFHTSWQADHEGKFRGQVTSIKSSSVNDGSRPVSLRLFPSTAHSWQSKRPHVFPLTKMETFLSRMPLKFHGLSL